MYISLMVSVAASFFSFTASIIILPNHHHTLDVVGWQLLVPLSWVTPRAVMGWRVACFNPSLSLLLRSMCPTQHDSVPSLPLLVTSAACSPLFHKTWEPDKRCVQLHHPIVIWGDLCWILQRWLSRNSSHHLSAKWDVERHSSLMSQE